MRNARSGRAVFDDLFKYGLASAAALAVDAATLALCHRALGFHHLAATAIGFLSGLALIYALSVACVFPDRRVRSTRAEIAGFLATGLAGLALTEALMHVFVDGAGLSVLFAKAPTAGLVFLFNFVTRRALIFSGSGAL